MPSSRILRLALRLSTAILCLQYVWADAIEDHVEAVRREDGRVDVRMFVEDGKREDTDGVAFGGNMRAAAQVALDQAKRQMEAPKKREENIDAMNERLTKWQDSLRAGRLSPKPVVDLEPASLSIEQRKVYLERDYDGLIAWLLRGGDPDSTLKLKIRVGDTMTKVTASLLMAVTLYLGNDSPLGKASHKANVPEEAVRMAEALVVSGANVRADRPCHAVLLWC